MNFLLMYSESRSFTYLHPTSVFTFRIQKPRKSQELLSGSGLSQTYRSAPVRQETRALIGSNRPIHKYANRSFCLSNELRVYMSLSICYAYPRKHTAKSFGIVKYTVYFFKQVKYLHNYRCRKNVTSHLM